ncbi:MAG: S1 family peptidase [Nitrososphaerota archaeon]|nr:S1 family peptidase [Nitrososphaerota archaeon]
MTVILFGAFMPALAVEETDTQTMFIDEAEEWLWYENIDRKLLKEDDMNSYSWLLFIDLINCFPKVLVPTENGDVKEIVEYPNEYAGAFIDEANRLHIVLTKPVDSETEYNYRKITGYDESVVYDVAKYPLPFLYDVQTSLGDVMAEFGIQSTSLNEFTNRLEVDLSDSTKEKDIVDFLTTKFNEFDTGCLTFTDSTGPMLPTASNTATNALAGSQTSANANQIIGSLGFNAYDKSTGQYGAVTAAHVAPFGATRRNALLTTIGSVSISKFGGTVDASFIPFSSGGNNISPSYNYYTSSPESADFLMSYCKNSFFVSGLSMHTIGNTTGHLTGTVLSVSMQGQMEQYVGSGYFVNFNDLLKVSNGVNEGDSGGIMYHQVWSGSLLSPPIKMIAGIIIARTGFIIYDGVGSKVENIMNELNIGLYIKSPIHQYVSGIESKTTLGYGAVNNWNGLIGNTPDGSYVQLYGGNYGDGGHVVGQMNSVSSGDIWVYAYSGNGYYTHFYTYVAYNYNGPWTLTKVQTVYGNGGGAQWINCGYANSGFRYIGLAGYDDNGMSANIFIDAVLVTQP